MIKAIFKDKEIRIFFIIAMLIGIAMSFIVSPWQVPDEQTHLYYIGGAIKCEEYDLRIEQSLGMDKRRVEWNPAEKTDWDQFVSALTKAPDYEMSEMLPKGFSLYAIRYAPAIIGMELAVILHLPTLWVLQFGELFALLFYVFVCSAALKKCPIKKTVMAIFMIAPMMMQGAGSLSYDAVAVPLLYWIICYVLHLRFEKEDITLKDMMLLILPWVWMSYIKVPYALVVLLGLMLPLNKFHIKIGKLEINEAFIRKYRWIALAVVVVLLAAALYILRDNVFIQVLYGVVTEIGRTIYLLGYTFITFYKELLVSSVGNFGWLNAAVCLEFAVLFYVVIFAITIFGKDNSKKIMTRWDRGVIWITFLMMTLITVFSMVHHTICNTYFWGDVANATYDIRKYLYMIPYIGGLQGRYFTPFISLFFVGFGSTEKLSGKVTKIIVGAFLLITYIYVFYILLNRFWIG